MDIRRFITRKQPHETDEDPSVKDLSMPTESSSTASSQTQDEVDSTSQDPLPTASHAKKQHLSASEKRKQYNARLSYKRECEKKYPWVFVMMPAKVCSVLFDRSGVTQLLLGQARE